MNKVRLTQIEALKDAVYEIQEEIEALREEEQEAYDNLPDSLQETDAGRFSLDCLRDLESANEGLDDVVTTLGNIIDNQP